MQDHRRVEESARDRRKPRLIVDTATAALLIVALLILLGTLSRRGEGELPADLGEIETGITADGFPYQGSPDAPVKMIEFSDYLCGHCRDFALEKEPLIVAEYVATGKVQYIFHYYALGEAQVLLGEASHCAADQGHFWKYHRVMFENQSSFTSISTLEDLQTLLFELAKQVGLDLSPFQTCWTSHQHQETVIEAVRSAREVGVGGTPSFSIQGQLIVGNQPFGVFQQAIEVALGNEG